MIKIHFLLGYLDGLVLSRNLLFRNHRLAKTLVSAFVGGLVGCDVSRSVSGSGR